MARYLSSLAIARALKLESLARGKLKKSQIMELSKSLVMLAGGSSLWLEMIITELNRIALVYREK